MSQRNADGQYPKKYYFERETLFEIMGFTSEETQRLIGKWNRLICQGQDAPHFLKEADMQFTKHQLLLLFTLSDKMKDQR